MFSGRFVPIGCMLRGACNDLQIIRTVVLTENKEAKIALKPKNQETSGFFLAIVEPERSSLMG